MPISSSTIDLSIVVTCHSEGILIHKTLASIARATALLDTAGLTHELIVHADNPTSEMEAYLTLHESDTLAAAKVFRSSFKDLGASRNFAISKAKGEFIATIDADDLMSDNWLHDAIQFLKGQTKPTVAHSELTVEFEGSNSIILKHGEIDRETDSLLSVFANRWNSVIVAPRQLLVDMPYSPNSPGFGYEDWHLNNRLIHAGIHHLLVPRTAIFVRRKKENSEWLRQIQSMAVLRANPLLSFAHIRSLSKNPFNHSSSTHAVLTEKSRTYKIAKNLASRHPVVHKITKKLHHIATRRRLVATQSFSVPSWLEAQWRSLHSVEKQLFPTKELLAHIPEYDSLTPEHRLAGTLYKTIVDSLSYDSYDYLLFVPWLIKGGADEYSINYANSIAQANPKKRVLVVATMATRSVWQEKLDPGVDFLDFGNITQGVANEIKYRLMSHIIENGSISHLHIINSEFGYDFIRLHKQYIKAADKKIIITSFSQSVDPSGRLYGYSHTHVPYVYDLATLITSDNQAVITMWENEYGFDAQKMMVHRQPVALPPEEPSLHKTQTPLRILWAARIAPEKQPELIAEIGKRVQSIATIDIYGTIEEDSRKYTQDLPPNVTYKGSFDGFDSLPHDSYDYLLYTSLFDGMPNTLLQAASVGLPIIASAVGGIPEFITKDTGILIHDISNPDAYAEAIMHAAKNPETGAVLSRNAYNALRKDFSPEAYKKAIKAFLARLKY